MRLSEIDRSKGLAIVLVVLGHFADTRTSHYVPNWYFFLRVLIYSFHMPFFMFLSGVVLSFSCPNLSSVGEWGKFVSKKFWRLMPAYFLFGGIVVIGKLALQKVLYVDNAMYHLTDLLNIIVFPMHSPAKFLWYIYVLFQIYCIFPVLMWGVRQNMMHLLALSILMQMVVTYTKVPDFLGLDWLCRMFFFFVSGALFGKHYDACSKVIDRYLALFVFAFCATLLLHAFVPVHVIVTGLIAIPACLGISRRWNSSVLTVCGKYCLSIYLMNMIFIGLTKGIFIRLFDLSEPLFMVLFVTCWVSGLYLPVLVKVYVFRYIGWLNRITD